MVKRHVIANLNVLCQTKTDIPIENETEQKRHFLLINVNFVEKTLTNEMASVQLNILSFDRFHAFVLRNGSTVAISES